MINDKILIDRENRFIIINKLLDEFNVVCLKANIMGCDKNIYNSKIIIAFYEKTLDKLPYVTKKRYESFDGSYILYTFSKDIYLKDYLISLEEKNKLGRLVDLDFYAKNKTFRREKTRKCLICNCDSFLCIRSRKHSINTLIKKVDEICYKHLEKVITKAVRKAMLLELNAHPKFGLVTKQTNGSHYDMDYLLMKDSIKVVEKAISQMFKIGYTESLDNIYNTIKQIGIKYEKVLLEHTNGINTYSGVIFSLGILASSLGFTLKNSINTKNVFEISKQISKDVLKEYEMYNTYGTYAYKQYKFGGARKESYNGFTSVQEVLKFIENKKLTNTNILKALVKAIILCEDTILLKRAKSINKYNEIKQKFIYLDMNYTKENINKLNDEMITNNISFGGSADILICALFIKIILDEIGEVYA